GCAAGCKQGDGALYPINPGGGTNPGGGGDGIDARAGSDANIDVIPGQVCLISDARIQSTCATTGAGGLTVTLDGKTATTQPDGTFVIDVPQSSNIGWQVTGNDIMTSVMSYSAVRHIPVMKQVDYFDLANSNAVTPTTGQGDLFVHVTHQGASVAMVSATAAPLAQFPTLYDGNAVTTWTQISTGAAGVVWIPGLPQGTVAVTLTPQGGTATVVGSIPIGDQTLTWVSAELP
ncbi:MAG TPA: hypothetical protein VFQ65_00900, partial [Kofleriaceae bacterium]|nr:hypothetical protein [Kofleriaceae bacterium]